ncbi:MAG: PTS sorbitol transporter subunit IIB [Defluviitaleaceae bacterium]|nr:PTS sorbitol transporter subunit IIB [Defluviitaleaceae bacterium]
MGKFLVIGRGEKGWGPGLKLPITEGKKILCMTGRGIDPLAQDIADKTGLPVVDGFKDAVADSDVFVAIVSCGGTLRCGVYPQKGIPTINLNPIGPSGPLVEHIKETNYISGVESEHIYVTEDATSPAPIAAQAKEISKETSNEQPQKVSQQRTQDDNFFIRFVGNVGVALGKIISMAFESAKEATNIVVTTVIPFMIFIGVLITLILQTGIGNAMAHAISPLAGSIWGLLIISIICGIPFLSPLLGPGAAIAQVVGVLVGTQIAAGSIQPQFALPALFAINVQVGADFVPVGLTMQQAEPDTIKYGTPAFLISRQITGPIAVVLAWLFSFGLF